MMVVVGYVDPWCIGNGAREDVGAGKWIGRGDVVVCSFSTDGGRDASLDD